jgi:putative salt-induced outer membrane protein YdiY
MSRASLAIRATATATATTAAAILAAASFATTATADEIRLKDGTVVHGRLDGIDGDIISITPGYNADGGVKSFKFKLDDVLNFSSDEAIYIGIGAESSSTADNIAYGRVEGTPSGIRVQTSTGVVTAPVTQVKVSYRTPAESPLAKQVKKLERKWAMELAADIRGKTGTSEQIGSSLGFTATNTGPNDTLGFYAKYNYYRTDKQKSADDLSAGIDYKCDISERFFWYARSNTGFNKINQIAFLTEAAAGLGFMAIKEDKHSLEFRVGGAYRYESYMTNDPYMGKFGLDAGMHYQFQWAWGKFEDKITFVPVFQEFENYIYRHEAFVEFPIAGTKDWFIRIGIQNDYNSRPVARVEKLDTTYSTRIVVKF